MPVYEYECANSHRFDLRQGFDSEPSAACPTCEADSRRIIQAVPVHYKGSGFYTTDYARSGSSAETSSEKSSEKESSESSTDKEPTAKSTGKSTANESGD